MPHLLTQRTAFTTIARVVGALYNLMQPIGSVGNGKGDNDRYDGILNHSD